MRSRPMVAAFDLLTCLLLMFVILALTESTAKPTVITNGILAVTDTWPSGSNNDVDLYVRDPLGNIVYFGSMTGGLMHLETDDLGTGVSNTVTLPSGQKVVSKYNGERVILRGVVPGEYTVNVQMYQKRGGGDTPVTIQLWSVRGGKPLLSQRVTLHGGGSEETAFRFTLNKSGSVVGHNRVKANLVGTLDCPYC